MKLYVTAIEFFSTGGRDIPPRIHKNFSLPKVSLEQRIVHNEIFR